MSLEYLQQIGQAKEAVKTIANTAVGQVVQDFAQSTVDEMRDEVPTASGTLKASIGFQFEANGEIITIKFLADDYWDYINSGVDGVEKGAGAMTNQFGSKYSFKTPNPSKNMVDAFAGKGTMQNWLASKGITSLRYGGKTHALVTDADYRGAAYVLARATKRHGIKPTPFVSNALSEEKIQAFEEALLNAFDKLI